MDEQQFREIEKKKRSLKRYKKMTACISRLEEKLALLDERLTAIKSPNYSGMPRGGVPVTAEDLISDKMDLEGRIKRLRKKRVNLKRSILEEIDSLEDPTLCEILESFFIDGLSMEDIADQEGYSVRRVYALYSEGVKLLTEKVQ